MFFTGICYFFREAKRFVPFNKQKNTLQFDKVVPILLFHKNKQRLPIKKEELP